MESISPAQVSRYLREAALQPHKSRYWLNANPLDDIKNTRKIDSVYIAGNRVSDK